MQLGASDAKNLTEKQQFYLDKVKAKLAKVCSSQFVPASKMELTKKSWHIYTLKPVLRSSLQRVYCSRGLEWLKTQADDP